MTINYLSLPKHIFYLILTLIFMVICYIIYFIYAGRLSETDINNLPILTQPTAQDRIIVFAPHQDDEVLGAGGFIVTSSSIGADVSIVFASDGNKHGLKNRRQQEAERASAVLNVSQGKLTFYDLPDGQLINYRSELSRRVVKTITEMNPTIVLVTDPHDVHPDHAVLGQAVVDAIREMKSKPTLYSYLIHYPKYPRPQVLDPDLYLLPPIDFDVEGGVWQKFDLNPDTVKQKRRAISQYQSQLHTPFLRSLMLSFIKRNELFLQVSP